MSTERKVESFLNDLVKRSNFKETMNKAFNELVIYGKTKVSINTFKNKTTNK